MNENLAVLAEPSAYPDVSEPAKFETEPSFNRGEF